MRLLNASEVANKLLVKPQRVYALTRSGDLPVIVLGDRQYRYTDDDVERYIESRRCVKNEVNRTAARELGTA